MNPMAPLPAHPQGTLTSAYLQQQAAALRSLALPTRLETSVIWRALCKAFHIGITFKHIEKQTLAEKLILSKWKHSSSSFIYLLAEYALLIIKNEKTATQRDG